MGLNKEHRIQSSKEKKAEIYLTFAHTWSLYKYWVSGTII